MHRAITLVAAVLPLFCCGCLFPYAYPSVSHLPPVDVGPFDTSTSFRVDVSERRSRFIGGSVSPTLAFAEKGDERTTPRSASVHLNHGLILFPVLHVGTRGYTCTKLYRRGFRTLVLEPWAEVDHEWVEAKDTEEQFQAILDLLFATPWHSAPIRLDWSEPAVKDEHPGRIHERTGWDKEDCGPYPFFTPQLRPGSWSAAHRKGLEFARVECEALLKESGVDDALRKRVEYLMHRLDEVIER